MNGQRNGKAARPRRAESPTTGKKALNLRMDEATIKLLKRHALDSDRTCSDVVAELVTTHLKPRSKG